MSSSRSFRDGRTQDVPVVRPALWPEQHKRHGGLAIAALVLGTLALVMSAAPGFCWVVGWPCGTLAVIFGAIAWKGWTKAKAGLVLGSLALIAGALWLVALVDATQHLS